MEENINLWNIKNLQPPPVSTYKIKSLIDVNGLTRAFKEAVCFFANLKHLQAEGAMLSRTISKTKMKYRMDKGFKCLLKLNRSLLQYWNMDFGQTINVFYELLPKIKIGTYVPSRNMLDYILVRLQGLTVLLSRIVETSQLSAHFMECKISSGDCWKAALVILGITSRIWIITKKLIRFCYQFYLNILGFRNKIEIVGPEWIPNKYQFPDNLETWLMEYQALEISKYERNVKQNTKTKLAERFSEPHTKTYTTDSFEFRADKKPVDEMHISSSNDNNFYNILQNNDIGKVVSRLVQSKNDTSDKMTNMEITNGNVTKNTNKKLLVNEIKTGPLEIRNKMISQEQKLVKTNILHDYFKKKYAQRHQTLKLTKIVEDNQNSCNSITEENNGRLMKTEIIISKQHKSKNNTSAKTEILFDENIQKVLVEDREKRLKNIIHDMQNVGDVLENIKSINDLKSFLKRQATSRDNQKYCVSSKLDRLQWHMLEKEIKKCIKKAHKTTDNSKNYLLRAKDLLKVSLT